ncbi:OLC1v1002736C1 [Oldenlandia corymbosa var. corymbosa]|uniref:OLC1v1002736C1 n=1 Tax=Oldenlandia corymbosa var. corymbosa TaxID=529605 RepID=A0AAV1D8J7_OLDCO|nr:OLC1v1002736C1 [Oldenlandia corymbosa var. corymbosa]
MPTNDDIQAGETTPPPPRSGRSNNGGASTSSTRVGSRADPFLVVCRCFSFLTAIAAILCIAVNILSAVRSFKDGSDVFDGIFRCYAVVIGIFVVVAEMEWGFIFKFWKVLEYWAGRGMLQIFVAVMTRAFPEYSGERAELVLLQNIACYLLLSCGVVYVVSGMLCIGSLKRARLKKEVSRDQAVKDLQELERRREELESLLLQETV